MESRHAHNVENAGSNPAPATMRIGDVVYVAYAPMNLGKVVGVRPDTKWPGHFEVQVKWRKTAQTGWMPEYHVRLLTDLIADHAKKLAGHQKRLKEMQAWVP